VVAPVDAFGVPLVGYRVNVVEWAAGRGTTSSFSREAILDAADELFVARGFFATSVRDIASSAGVTAASIYRLFDSKEAVLHAAVERRAEALRSEFALAEGDGWERLDVLIDRLYHPRSRDPLLAALLRQAVARLEDDPGRMDHLGIEPLLEDVTAFLQREMDEGVFAPRDPRQVVESMVAELLLAAHSGALPSWFAGGLGGDDRAAFLRVSLQALLTPEPSRGASPIRQAAPLRWAETQIASIDLLAAAPDVTTYVENHRSDLIVLGSPGQESVPQFQLHAGSEESVLEVNQVLDAGRYPDSALVWWVSHSEALGARRPIDLLGTADEASLVEAARGRLEVYERY
jgi:AcrR family transcriptional regulator